MYVKTKDALESNYLVESSYRDTVLKHKVARYNEFSTYKIKADERFRVTSGIGGPSPKNIAFDWIELMAARDTMILDSKEKIFKQLVRKGKPAQERKGRRLLYRNYRLTDVLTDDSRNKSHS